MSPSSLIFWITCKQDILPTTLNTPENNCADTTYILLTGFNELPVLTSPSCMLCVRCMLSRFSHVWLFATLWTAAHQAPLSTGFSRQEYWSGLLCPPPGDLPDPGIEPVSLMSPALAGRLFTTSATWETLFYAISDSRVLDTTPVWTQTVTEGRPHKDRRRQSFI